MLVFVGTVSFSYLVCVGQQCSISPFMLYGSSRQLVDIVVAFALSEMDNNELTNIPLLKSFPWLGKDHFSFVES